MLQNVVNSCERYIQGNKFVKIEFSKIQELVDEIISSNKCSSMHLPNWNDKVYSPDLKSVDDLSQFLFIGNAVNFKFWNKTYLDKYEHKGMKGTEALWAAISGNKHILDANILVGIGLDEIDKIFGNIPMKEDRLKTLNETGIILKNKYGGKIINLIKECNYSVPSIVNKIVLDFPCWNDSHEGLFFYKRAQLFIQMLYCRTFNEKILNGIEYLTVLSDYQIPKGLNYIGILKYSNELTNKISNRICIDSCSKEELEIRASTIVAGNKIIELMSRSNVSVNAIEIDSYLWNFSRNIGVPHHQTSSIWY